MLLSWIFWHHHIYALFTAFLLHEEVMSVRLHAEVQKGTRHIRGNVCFDISIFSSLSFTKPCFEFILISFARDLKIFYQISRGNQRKFPQKSRLKMNFKTNCELLQNHTENQFMPSKTTVNWLFNNICYLVIDCKVLLYP